MKSRLPEVFLISNAEIWNSDGIQKNKDIWIEDGQITDIRNTGSGEVPDLVFDAKGYVLLPAGLDLQVHLRVPGQPEKETPRTGLLAALRGGVGGVLTMPNTKPVIDTPEILALAKKECAAAEEMTGTEVFFSAAMTMGQQGEFAVDALKLKAAGAVALTDDGRGVASDTVMEAVFAQGALSGLPLLQHAEMPGHGGVLAPGKTQRDLKIPSYSAEAEWKMVERDIALARKYPAARYHVLHISAKETVELIRQARKEGLNVTGEVSPHHLFFCADDIPQGDTSFKMNPPLRAAEDRQVLREALADGTLSFVATDHAPHEEGAKGHNFLASAFGTTGLETSLRVLLTLYQQKLLTAERVVEVFSAAPARFIGVQDRYGKIAVGTRIDHLGGGLVLCNPFAHAQPIATAELESQSKNNCFIGAELAGKILAVANVAGWHQFERAHEHS